ncbi:Carbohydrate-binding module family 1 protein [Mycena kentingensis (nom. inval.)]|nr:Carbohydrate-binding module family 1 protein [Mycena kentingensis (nom. inval.)]
MARLVATLGLLVISCNAGSILWNGNFDAYPTVATFDLWSFANPVGQYQWYIHGAQNTSRYLALGPAFKNPADTSEKNGLRMTIDPTATWNSQFERAELIPQVKSGVNLGQGNLYYHFSISHPSTNLPDPTLEHQICFFESHFTELKYGLNGTRLQWHGVPRWDTAFTAGVWLNFAYDIDFSASTVGLWASTGSSPLVKVVQNIAASTFTNSQDWHLGILRLVNGGGASDFYFSGVYIENGPITTSVGTGGGTVTTPVSTTTGWAGPTVCQAPFICKPISPPFYFQCLSA